MRCKSPPPWWTDRLSWPLHKSLTISNPSRSAQATGNNNSLKGRADSLAECLCVVCLAQSHPRVWPRPLQPTSAKRKNPIYIWLLIGSFDNSSLPCLASESLCRGELPS